MNDGATLLNLLFAAFDEAGIPRQELADAAEVTVTAISQYRSEGSSRRWPSYQVLERLLRFANQRGILPKVWDSYGRSAAHLIPQVHPPRPLWEQALYTTSITRREFHILSTPVVFAAGDDGSFVACEDLRTAGVDAPGMCFGAAFPTSPVSLSIPMDSVTVGRLRSVWLVLHPVVLPPSLKTTDTGQAVFLAVLDANKALAEEVLAATRLQLRFANDPFEEVYRAPINEVVIPVGASADHVVDLTSYFSRDQALPTSWEHAREGHLEGTVSSVPGLPCSTTAALELELPELPGRAFPGFYVRASLCALVETHTSVGSAPLNGAQLPGIETILEPSGTDVPATPPLCAVDASPADGGRATTREERVKTRLQDRRNWVGSSGGVAHRHRVHTFVAPPRAEMIIEGCQLELPALPESFRDQQVVLSEVAECFASGLEINVAPYPVRIPFIDAVIKGDGTANEILAPQQLSPVPIELYLPPGSQIDCRYAGSRNATGSPSPTDKTPDEAALTFRVRFVERAEQFWMASAGPPAPAQG